MKTYQAHSLTNKSVILVNHLDIGELYELLKKEDDPFLIEADGVTTLIMSSPLWTKVKNGDFFILASKKNILVGDKS